MTTRVPLVALIILTFAFVYPFLFTIAGDAQVHLVVSENYASGYPFQYDRTGEIGTASTSPFWTMMLTFFFWLTGHWTPLLLKVIVVLIWGIVFLMTDTGCPTVSYCEPASQNLEVGIPASTHHPSSPNASRSA